MGKQKIGKDVTDKGASIISSPKESREYQEWLEEQKQEKKAEEAEEIEGKELKYPIPMEKEPSADQVSEEMAKVSEEMEKAKALGKLKVSKIVLSEGEE